jgi:hypothetical protein
MWNSPWQNSATAVRNELLTEQLLHASEWVWTYVGNLYVYEAINHILI